MVIAVSAFPARSSFPPSARFGPCGRGSQQAVLLTEVRARAGSQGRTAQHEGRCGESNQGEGVMQGGGQGSVKK